MNNPNLKVCPGCGSMPWDFANPGKEQENQPEFCQDCGDRLVAQSELPRDIWKDPYVKTRLKEGVPAWDIFLLCCSDCNQLGYYNQGSTFSCRFCDITFFVVNEGETFGDGVRNISVDEMITLSDSVTECGDGYHNHTL